MTELPKTEEEWADLFYCIHNYADAREKAKALFPLIEGLQAQVSGLKQLSAAQSKVTNKIEAERDDYKAAADALSGDVSALGCERDGLRNALQASTDRAQRFLDTFGDLGDCVTQADINDWREVLATPAVSDAPGHTDLMVTPESIDAWLEKNPLTSDDPDADRRGGQ